MIYHQESIARAEELKSRIEDYMDEYDNISKGLKLSKEYETQKKRILEILGASNEDWDDYKWQLQNRINSTQQITKILNLSEDEVKSIEKISNEYRWAISPYYASLIDPNDKFDPIKLLSIPTVYENVGLGSIDPMNERGTNPAGSITRRYPDRLIINTTNVCAMYCRHCQRRRNISDTDTHQNKNILQESIDYIRDNKEIRDVLITGGDPLTMSDQMLEWLISEVRKIEHVEIIRLGTRTPVTLPQRITDELVDMLKKYHPIYINTHFNHPKEVTNEAKLACEKLANAGIPLGNQAVLLNGINNDKHVMKCLNQELLKIRVRPYYIFHAKYVIGTEHFVTSIDEGIEIIEYLRGYTSGMAIPTYIVNAPGGLGKTPILPQYLISRGKNTVKIRTWEGNVLEIKNTPSVDLRKIL